MVMIASSAPWTACRRRNVVEHCGFALALERKHYRKTYAATGRLSRFATHQLQLDELYKNLFNYLETCSAVRRRRRTTPPGRHEKARFRALEHEAGQPAGRKRSGVDVDPVW